jgi:hypothetical protein
MLSCYRFAGDSKLALLLGERSLEQGVRFALMKMELSLQVFSRLESLGGKSGIGAHPSTVAASPSCRLPFHASD